MDNDALNEGQTRTWYRWQWRSARSTSTLAVSCTERAICISDAMKELRPRGVETKSFSNSAAIPRRTMEALRTVRRCVTTLLVAWWGVMPM